MTKLSRLEKLLQPTASGAVRLTDTETARFRQAWRHRFAARLDPMLSAESSGGFDWHAFSYDKFPHLTGDAARNAYQAKAVDLTLVVLPHSTEGSGFKVRATPDFSGKNLDVYIFPEDLSWTMVFTHENGWFGPYFATADN